MQSISTAVTENPRQMAGVVAGMGALGFLVSQRPLSEVVTAIVITGISFAFRATLPERPLPIVQGTFVFQPTSSSAAQTEPTSESATEDVSVLKAKPVTDKQTQKAAIVTDHVENILTLMYDFKSQKITKTQCKQQIQQIKQKLQNEKLELEFDILKEDTDLIEILKPLQECGITINLI